MIVSSKSDFLLYSAPIVCDGWSSKNVQALIHVYCDPIEAKTTVDIISFSSRLHAHFSRAATVSPQLFYCLQSQIRKYVTLNHIPLFVGSEHLKFANCKDAFYISVLDQRGSTPPEGTCRYSVRHMCYYHNYGFEHEEKRQETE